MLKKAFLQGAATLGADVQRESLSVVPCCSPRPLSAVGDNTREHGRAQTEGESRGAGRGHGAEQGMVWGEGCGGGACRSRV